MAKPRQILTPEQIEADLASEGLDEDYTKQDSQIAIQEQQEKENPTSGELPDESELEPEDIRAPEKTTEEQAKEQGWQEGGELDAKEYLERGPLYDEIKKRGRETKELKATLDALKSHIEKKDAAESQQTLAMLEAQKDNAIASQDIKSVREIDIQIAAQGNPSVAQTGAVPEVSDFVERNKAWIKDPSFESQQMRDFANKRDIELVQYNLTPTEHMDTVQKDLEKQFPHKFRPTAPANFKPSAPSVESDAAPVRSNPKLKHTFSDLSKDQREACRYFVKRGIMTTDQYIKDMENMGEL